MRNGKTWLNWLEFAVNSSVLCSADTRSWASSYRLTGLVTSYATVDERYVATCRVLDGHCATWSQESPRPGVTERLRHPPPSEAPADVRTFIPE
jgi:hypothetical protein